MVEIVGLELPGWRTEDRERVTKKRMNAVDTQLKILMREVYDFSQKPKPLPRKGFEDIAPALKDLLGDWLAWYQVAQDQPTEAFEDDSIPKQLDELANRYHDLRQRVQRVLKSKGKRTRSVPAETIVHETSPNLLDSLSKVFSGPTSFGIGIGAIAVLLFFALRK